MGRAERFPSAAHFRSFTGLAPKASETGNTDRKGHAMSKAGNALLRTTLIRAADWARKQDPQLARIYHGEKNERGQKPPGKEGRRGPPSDRAGLVGHAPRHPLRAARHRR